MAKYNPLEIANGFLERGFRDSIAVDHMKVQKLLFFSHGYYLALTGEPLLNERFEAWKLGPVVPSVYRRLKKFGAAPINEYAEVYDANLRAFRPAAPPEGDASYEKVREFVWDNYGTRESIALSKLTHKAGGAWDKTIRTNPGIVGPQISEEAIKGEFAPLIEPADAA